MRSRRRSIIWLWPGLMVALSACASDPVAGWPGASVAPVDRVQAVAGDAQRPDRAHPTPGARSAARRLSPLEHGLALLRADQPEAAHAAFVRALRTGVRPAAALTGAGLAAEARGMLGAARRYFEMARDLAPRSDVVHNNLGVVLYRMRDYGSAHRAFRTAFALSSGRNEAAARSMKLAQAAASGEVPDSDDLLTHRLQRTGSGSYHLSPIAKAPSTAAPSPHIPPQESRPR